MFQPRWSIVWGLVLLVGCKKEEPKPDPQPMQQPKLAPGDACDPTAQPTSADAGTGTSGTGGGSDTTGGDNQPAVCAPGLACEPVANANDKYVCGTALEIRGRISDATTGDAIEGALVAALDDTGAPVTDVVASDSCGDYVLPLSVRRDANGDFAETPKWTLTVSAQDYLPFPEGARPALPLDITEVMPDPNPPESSGTDSGGGSGTAGDTGGQMVYVVDVIENAASSVALIPLPDAEQGGSVVKGTVEGEHAPGTLVVGEGAKGRVPYAFADASGEYTLFNVPDGDISVHGYRQDLELDPASVTVSGADADGVDLTLVSETRGDLGTVDGSLNIVNAPGGSMTSVVLVPTSVYNDALERGPVPVGLRVPDPPKAPNVTSAFSFAGVPSGTYKVLVAFENDDLVRDPDTAIAGTDIQEVTLGRGESTTVPDAFKVTEALAVVSPGANQPEAIDGKPDFVFADDSSEDGYELIVLDALGNMVWNTEIAAVTGSNNVTVPYGGPALTAGMYYQFRATSYREQKQSGTRSYISRTEDLRGVFVYGQAPPPPDCTAEQGTGTGGGTTGGN